MLPEQLTQRLSEYDDWRDHKVTDGWLPITTLDLRAPVEYLLADGRRHRARGTSNAEWLCAGLKPVAWRPLDAPATETPDMARLHGGII
jgi:hypothetical protein